ncbi:hypothetical protein D3C74_257600 [compost metagenome]
MSCNVEIEKASYPTVFAGGRCSGKTTRLLREASERGLAIVTLRREMKRCLKQKANEIGVEVEVLTVDEINQRKFLGVPSPKKVLIDEAQLMLDKLLGVNTVGMSITTYHLHKLDCLKSANGGPEVVMPLGKIEQALKRCKQDNTLYSEKVYNRANLTSAMDALDRLGKTYTVKKVSQQGILNHYWLIQEES